MVDHRRMLFFKIVTQEKQNPDSIDALVQNILKTSS